MVYSRVYYTNPDNQNYFDDELVEIASNFGGRFVDAEDKTEDCCDCGDPIDVRCLLFEYRTRAKREQGERAMELHLVWIDGFEAGMMAAMEGDSDPGWGEA
jgi:hypothetical protein